MREATNVTNNENTGPTEHTEPWHTEMTCWPTDNTKQIAVPSQTLYGKAYENNSAAQIYPQLHCRKTVTNTRRNTETIINLLFSSGTLAATLTNYEIKKVKNKIKNKEGMGTTKNPKKQNKKCKKGQPIKKQLKTKKKIDQKIQKNTKNKNRFLFSWGAQSFSIFLLLCSCCTPATNHQSRHPPQDRHVKHHLHLILYQWQKKMED